MGDPHAPGRASGGVPTDRDHLPTAKYDAAAIREAGYAHTWSHKRTLEGDAIFIESLGESDAFKIASSFSVARSVRYTTIANELRAIQLHAASRRDRTMRLVTHITNVKGVQGTIKDPKLPPNSIDLVIMVDVYHEFSFPYEMMQGIVKSLKPGGRVAFVEYRGEDPKVPIKRLHKMTEAQVKKEAALFALKHVETYKKLPWQHVVFFRKVVE